MNSKTLSIYSAIMAVTLVAGIASTTVGTVYATTKLKNEMMIRDCTKNTEAVNRDSALLTHLYVLMQLLTLLAVM